MKLILFRHGIAIDRELAILKKIEDAKRPLTDKGREKTDKMAKILKEWDEEIDLIVSSPLLRAQQTAEILAQLLKAKEFKTCAELVPSAPPQAFAQWLKQQSKSATSILAVGHEPQLSVFASWALAKQPESFIGLKKSGMLCLELNSFEEVHPKSAQLSWLVQPKLFSK